MGREVAGHVMGIVPEAFKCVREAIEKGDAKIAMQLLTATGALQSGGRIAGMEVAATKGGSAEGLTINVNVAQDEGSKAKQVDVKPVKEQG